MSNMMNAVIVTYIDALGAGVEMYIQPDQIESVRAISQRGQLSILSTKSKQEYKCRESTGAIMQAKVEAQRQEGFGPAEFITAADFDER